MTENLTAASDFYDAIGMTRGVDWDVTRLDDGTPVAKALTADADARAVAAVNAAVGCLNGWRN